MSTGRNVFNRFVYPKNKNNVLLLDEKELSLECTVYTQWRHNNNANEIA